MAMTDVQICNLALSRIGNGKPISSLADLTNEGRACNDLYAICRDFVLEAHDWEFATRRVNALTLPSQVGLPTNWAYQYTYPADCLKVRRIFTSGSPRRDEKIPFQVVYNGTSRLILTNQQSAGAEYVAQVTDPTQYDMTFVSILAYYLASELALRVAESGDLSKANLATFQAMLAEVKKSAPEGMEQADVSAFSGDTVSVLSIINLALARIGHEYYVADIAEHTKEARIASQFYARCRDELVSAYAWTWATKRAALASAVELPPTNWTYSWTYPADCLKAREIVLEGYRQTTKDLRVPFEIGTPDGAKRLIYTDVDSPELVYTMKVTDITMFDAKFVDALAWRLAVELVLPLRHDPKLVQYAAGQYTMAIRAAAAADGNEGESGVEPDCDLIRVRY